MISWVHISTTVAHSDVPYSLERKWLGIFYKLILNNSEKSKVITLKDQVSMLFRILLECFSRETLPSMYSGGRMDRPNVLLKENASFMFETNNPTASPLL